ncbi:hypothetical protein MD535_23825 [Vibrio sp. ZSDZ65]|uniref:Acyl-coenzyme A:6-aminopenicillanic acid acyl-transferase n=1 Tax=Vibrio qingdaonensis TaxID=2829491 RepID=A0A9X3HZ32_9VIBR|nr:hypothetical protein [Vibrio qingdaonensis]MCW8349024.1 hypothetical protein [Vibrio qingdaonensis]
MKLKLLSSLVLSMATLPVIASTNVLGDNLPYFSADRPAIQEAAYIIDATGKSPEEIGVIIAKSALGRGEELTPLGDSAKLWLDIAAQAIKNIEKVNYAHLRMLRAQAEYRGVTVETLVASMMAPDLLIDSAVTGEDVTDYINLPNGCTSIAYNNGLVGQTLDWPINSIKEDTTLLKTDYQIGEISDGTLFQQMGRKVGVTITHLGRMSIQTTADYSNIITLDALASTAAQMNSVEEVIALAKQYKLIVPMNMTVADDKGGYAAINVAGEDTVVHRGNDKGVAFTNHTQYLRDKLLPSGVSAQQETEVNTKNFWTFARKDAAENFIRYTPELTIESMKYLFTSKPVNLSKYNGNEFVTTKAFIWDLNTGCAEFAPENPLFMKEDYTKVCFE